MTDRESNITRPSVIQAPAEFAGGEEELGDIEGYWDAASPDRNHKSGEGPGARYGSPPMQWTPLHATVIDSGLEVGKSSTLIHGRLNKPAVLRSAVKAEGELEFPAGTVVGVWAKAGLKDLKKLAGVDVWMANGQNIRGKAQFFKHLGVEGRSPMVLFTIRPRRDGKTLLDAKGNPVPPENLVLTVKNDYREESLPDADKARRERRQRRREELAEATPLDLDDLPF